MTDRWESWEVWDVQRTNTILGMILKYQPWGLWDV